MYLSEQEKKLITKAIRDAEAKTTAELVTVIAQRSDDYYYIPTLWAALIALSFPGLLALLEVTIPYAYLWQVAVFFIGAVLFQWSPLKLSLIPTYIKHQRASQYAHQLFYMQNLHATQGQTGLMLFVSVEEKYAEIIADYGIAQQVNEAQWQKIIDEFVGLVKQNDIANGYMVAVTACGELLQQHFPGDNKDANELPDHLIEI